jgi:hypothetical protein
MMSPAALVLVLFVDATAASDLDPRAGAWDKSVAQEIGGDLGEAEKTMTRAWGSLTDNYWVSLRLAYLALLQGRYQEAAKRYRSLRDRPEAEFDADVEKGQASAAKALDETRGPAVAPELWGIFTSHSLGRYKYQGGGAYAHLAFRLTDRMVVRAAGRFISASRSSGRSPWAFSSQGDSWSLNEEYLALGWSSQALGVEASVARSATSDDAAILGGATGLRLGSRWGAILQAAFLRKGGVADNWQVRPRAFVWPSAHLGLDVGARATLDTRGNSISGNVGLSALWHPFALTAEGFVGSERWAFDFAGPSIMSFDSETPYGGTLTAAWRASPRLRVALQGDAARLHDDSAWGNYWSISLGVHYGPELR